MIHEIAYSLDEYTYRIENNKLVVSEKTINPSDVLSELLIWSSKDKNMIEFGEILKKARKCLHQQTAGEGKIPDPPWIFCAPPEVHTNKYSNSISPLTSK